jgi:hypothetical protein
MTEHIFEEVRADLAREAGRALHGITDVFRHHGYHDRNATFSVPEEPPVNLTQLAADIRTDLQSAEDKAGEVYNHAKAVLEEKLPQIEAIGKTVGSDRLFQIAMDDTIPAPLRELGADILGRLFAAFPAPAAPAEAPAA